MNEDGYELYKIAKRIIEKGKGYYGEDHSHEPIFKAWQAAIDFMDKSEKGYAERYEKEKRDGAI